MPTLPTGTNATLQYLAELIAASATFQAWTGTTNPEDAVLRVHQVEVLDESETDSVKLQRPLAVVWEETVNYTFWAFKNSGLTVMFQADVSAVYRADGAEYLDRASAKNEFMNQVEDVTRDMTLESHQGGRLHVTQIQQIEDTLTRSSPEEGEDYYQVLYMVASGLEDS